MALSDFDIDLRFGQAGEQTVANLLTIETVEVKTDRRWKETGNVYIETYFYSLSQKEYIPSGINISKATHWAFNLEGTILIVERNDLINAIRAYGTPISTPIEPNPSKGFLMKPENILLYIKDKSSEHTK
jgi:hypothetical protein